MEPSRFMIAHSLYGIPRSLGPAAVCAIAPATGRGVVYLPYGRWAGFDRRYHMPEPSSAMYPLVGLPNTTGSSTPAYGGTG